MAGQPALGARRSARLIRMVYMNRLYWLLLIFATSMAHAAETPAPPPATPSTTQPGPAYAIYPGDQMKVSVFDHPDLSLVLHIPSNGRITFPLIGEIKDLVGRPVEDVEREIKRRLEDGYITEAIVTISFIEFGPRNAFVMGDVKKPSAVPLSPFAPTTALQAISTAGGFSDEANRSGAHVIRDDPAHPGQKIALPVPSGDHGDALTGDVTLNPGDIIIVPRLDRIFIIGQVQKPGAIELPGQDGALTVSKAIGMAGGFDRFGRQDEVQLIRDGKTMVVVNVRDVLAGKKNANDPQLRPGDTVFVPETRF
jgi:polysaccharide export outer membrane protein